MQPADSLDEQPQQAGLDQSARRRRQQEDADDAVAEQLGPLAGESEDAHAAHGMPGQHDRSGRHRGVDDLPEVALATLKQTGPRTADGWAFEGEVPLATPGAFGYTVRVVPRHVGLVTPSELGLVAWA